MTMTHLDDDSSAQIHRDLYLGVLAAKAEEGRRLAEASLEVERRRSSFLEGQRSLLETKLASASALVLVGEEAARAARAVKDALSVANKEAEAQQSELTALRAELAGLRWQSSLHKSLRTELERAQDASAAAQSELQTVWQQLGATQESSSALQEEVHALRQQLEQAQEYAKGTVSMQAEMKKLRQEVVDLQPGFTTTEELKDEVRRLQHELAGAKEASVDGRMVSSPSNGADEALQQALRGREEADAEVLKLRRDLRGIKIVTTALEKKVKTYEQRLLEHSKTCADELDSMQLAVDGEASNEESFRSDETVAALAVGFGGAAFASLAGRLEQLFDEKFIGEPASRSVEDEGGREHRDAVSSATIVSF